MVKHPPGPGLEDGDEAGIATEVFGIAAEVAQSLRALAEQQTIEFARMAQAGRAQLRRDGDGD
jgi:hypothetical protein